MQIDKDKLRNILNLSDDELKKKVTDAVNSGAFEQKDRENLDKALQSMKEIKNTLANIDEDTIKKAMDAMGVDKSKLEEIKKNLKN
jgi:hypothetical protein